METMKHYFIDLFCGAGGVTTGIHNVNKTYPNSCQVIACVNHDEKAIESHAANHPDTQHFIEDVRAMDLSKLRQIVEQVRTENCKIHLWASLECTNFSIAKGGKPKDADSRSLASAMPAYLEAINPDYFWVENVKEFMSWGPLDKKGKPLSRKSGRDYIRWVKQIQNMGYDYDYKILNCADYGAYTSRVRYFGCFARKGLSYSFPLPTHAKKPISGMFGQLKKWKPVREVLDLHDTGKSIFDRKKDLSDRTLERILSGLKKFGGQHFLQQYYSGDPKNKVKPLNAPCPTLTTIPHEGLVAVIQYNGNSDSHRVNKPIGTLTTKDRFGVVQYLFNPQYQSKGGSIDNPCFTLIARMDKAPPGLLTAVPAPLIADKETDTPTMKQLKNYMRQHQIGDVHMRMLNIPELKRITGLPVDYTLLGTKANQKKFIGNAVPPPMVAALIGECVG